jgi:hypothetical protein
VMGDACCTSKSLTEPLTLLVLCVPVRSQAGPYGNHTYGVEPPKLRQVFVGGQGISAMPQMPYGYSSQRGECDTARTPLQQSIQPPMTERDAPPQVRSSVLSSVVLSRCW